MQSGAFKGMHRHAACLFPPWRRKTNGCLASRGGSWVAILRALTGRVR